MDLLHSFAADVIAISVLCFAVYYPRHRRRELLVAFLGVNVGVLAVTTALVSSDATLGPDSYGHPRRSSAILGA